MNDLISRSELIKHFEAVQSQENAIGLDFVAIIDDIKEQPTAYDVDKVVERLNRETISSSIKESLGLLKAIEIVKQGGVYDDVCEWIKYDYKTICPKNHDANNPYWRIPDNMDKLKYCPYCGKKIKVVE